MDHLHARLEALESQVHTLHQHVHTVDQRLRWWRGLACGLGGLGASAGRCRRSSRKKTPLTKARRGWHSAWRL